MLHIYLGTAQLSEVPRRKLLSDLSICPLGPRALGAQREGVVPVCPETPGAQPPSLAFSGPAGLGWGLRGLCGRQDRREGMSQCGRVAVLEGDRQLRQRVMGLGGPAMMAGRRRHAEWTVNGESPVRKMTGQWWQWREAGFCEYRVDRGSWCRVLNS